MSEHKNGHELYNKNSGARDQSGVRVAAGASRTRDSTKSGNKQSKKSSKASLKRSSGQRNKPSTASSKHAGSTRKKATGGKDAAALRSPSAQRKIKQQPDPSGRTSRSPHSNNKTTSRTPTTPNSTTTPPTGRTPGKRGSPSPGSKPRQDAQEKTVFENDAGGGMAETRIKERKLQWKQNEMTTSPISATHTNMETSPGSHDEPYGGSPKKEEKPLKPLEADTTIKDRTIFENDDNSPAPVKEAERQLQWAPGAGKVKGGAAAADKPVSCYLAPTMQVDPPEMIKMREDDKKK